MSRFYIFGLILTSYIHNVAPSTLMLRSHQATSRAKGGRVLAGPAGPAKGRGRARRCGPSDGPCDGADAVFVLPSIEEEPSIENPAEGPEQCSSGSSGGARNIENEPLDRPAENETSSGSSGGARKRPENHETDAVLAVFRPPPEDAATSPADPAKVFNPAPRPKGGLLDDPAVAKNPADPPDVAREAFENFLDRWVTLGPHLEDRFDEVFEAFAFVGRPFRRVFREYFARKLEGMPSNGGRLSYYEIEPLARSFCVRLSLAMADLCANAENRDNIAGWLADHHNLWGVPRRAALQNIFVGALEEQAALSTGAPRVVVGFPHTQNEERLARTFLASDAVQHLFLTGEGWRDQWVRLPDQWRGDRKNPPSSAGGPVFSRWAGDVEWRKDPYPNGGLKPVDVAAEDSSEHGCWSGCSGFEMLECRFEMLEWFLETVVMKVSRLGYVVIYVGGNRFSVFCLFCQFCWEKTLS